MKAESYQSGRVASDGYVRELAGELLHRADKARERKKGTDATVIVRKKRGLGGGADFLRAFGPMRFETRVGDAGVTHDV